MNSAHPNRVLLLVIFITIVSALCSYPLQAITLMGVNGKAVEFAGIKDATPKGITGQLTPESSVIGVPWDKLDIEALKNENWMIHSAYKLALEGETVSLNLGTYADPDAGKTKNQHPGWIGTNMGNVDYFMRLPLGKGAIRGILIIAAGDLGYAMPEAVQREGEPDRWGDFQSEHRFALMSYEFEHEVEDKSKVHSFAFAEKKSGRMTLEAIKKIAAETNRPELVELPIALHGCERTGAAFAYSFLHLHPEKVIAAVMGKGAFYDAEPTEASTEVPCLFLWGHYSDNAERWGSENSVETVFQKESVKSSNWTSAREFRGKAMINSETDYFGRQYLMEMIRLRLPEESGESEVSDEDGEAVSERAPFVEIDRSKGFIGTIKTAEVAPMEGATSAMEEGTTFIPSSKVSSLWKAYGNGSLEAR